MDFGMELPLKLSNNCYNKDGIDEDKVNRIIFHKKQTNEQSSTDKYNNKDIYMVWTREREWFLNFS